MTSDATPQTADVIDFVSYRNRELIEILEEALAEAKTGEITAALMVFKRNKRNHGVVVVGEYENQARQLCDICGEIFVHFRKQLPAKAVVIE